MASFDQLGLSSKALDAVALMGFSEPTPVQEQVIPLVLKKRDIIAAAKTGTGKTAAFALPTLDTLGHAKGGSGPLMLVVTPTRELAQQISEVCELITTYTHHRVTTVVGGLSYKPQIDKLKHGCDVLIATPGRLIDLMNQKAVRLSDVNVLVLDEADRMLDMGFLPSMKKIVAATPRQRQTLLFSATIDASIEKVAPTLLNHPAIVQIAQRGEVADTIDQYVIHTTQAVKPALLNALLQEKGWQRVIVFTRTRSRADATCRRLRRAAFSAEAIHSSRTQNQRRRSLEKFTAGEVNIICATDVLARGIDIDHVDYVVNYDLPTQPEDYIHRVGRTGRAGEAGFAVSFVTPETESALRDIEKITKQHIPELTLEHFDQEVAEREAAAKSGATKSSQQQQTRGNKSSTTKPKSPNKKKQSAKQPDANKQQKPATENDAKKKPQTVKNARSKKPSQRKRGDKQQAKPNQETRGKKRQTTKTANRMKSRQTTGDFRPGRAHRAEVNRKRSHNSR